MAIRARSDNLSLDHPVAGVATPVAPLVDFSELWAHREALRQACVRMVGNEATAEDLVQETYLRALKSHADLDQEQSPGPWLATVARRRSIDELRSRRWLAVVETPPEPDAFSPGSEDPAQHVVNQELVDRLRAALAELTSRERQILLRQVSHGMSLAELASEESTSVASVRSVLARARQKLRMSLERGGAWGALPLPRLLGSLRERFHRWAHQAEASLPLFTGAGVQVGQALVAAVVAILVALVGSAMPPPGPGTELAALASSVKAEAEATTDAAHAHGILSIDTNGAVAAEADTGVQGGGPPPSVPTLPVPSLPQDSASRPEQTGVTAITPTSDPGTIFLSGKTYVSGEPSIFRTTDGGHSWVRLEAAGFEREGGVLLVPPSYPVEPTLFAVGPTTLSRSDDGGKRFDVVAPARGFAAISPNYSSGDRRIVIAGSPLVEYRVDTGLMQPLPATPPSADIGDIAFVPGAASPTLVLGGSTLDGTNARTAAVYRCTAATCDRRQVMTGLSAAPSVAVSHRTPGTVFAWRPNRLDRSTDGGTTFATLTMPTGLGLSQVTDGPGGTIFVAGLANTAASGLYSSADGGVTWSPMATGTALATGTRVVAVIGSRILAAPILDKGLLCSVDGGATWAPRCPAAV